ncbi:MAG: aspartyl protease family protein [Rubrivivax sp.]
MHIGPSNARRRTLQRQGRPVPPPVQASLLIDTGASMSLVDAAVMRSLQLTPTGATLYHSTSTNGVAQPCDIYDVQFILGGVATPSTLRIDPLAIMAPAFINHPFEGLLGRDVLGQLQVAWNGPGQTVRIEYP